MKKFLLLLGFVVSLSAFQPTADSDKIVTALKQGDAAQFSSFLDNFIDLKLPEKDEVKSVGKTQAGITLKSFFDANSINGFELSSQREMGGTSYMTGKLQGGSKSYNITILMKAKGDKLSIITIRIN
ncbi:MAG TPA: DUF4783 domain-containing protein [Panacibacter sp.]|nr:DUF4783 domain-containing protein [Panacibacter sp.]